MLPAPRHSKKSVTMPSIVGCNRTSGCWTTSDSGAIGRGADRVVQLIGRRDAHMRPDIAEMRSKEPVEFRLEIGIEIIAVPPEPVAAFGGVQFLPGRSRVVRRKTRREIHKL